MTPGARPAARVTAFIAMIALSILAETVVRRRRNRPSDAVDTANSMAIGVGFHGIMMIGAHVLLLPAYTWVYEHVRLLHLAATNTRAPGS